MLINNKYLESTKSNTSVSGSSPPEAGSSDGILKFIF